MGLFDVSNGTGLSEQFGDGCADQIDDARGGCGTAITPLRGRSPRWCVRRGLPTSPQAQQKQNDEVLCYLWSRSPPAKEKSRFHSWRRGGIDG